MLYKIIKNFVRLGLRWYISNLELKNLQLHYYSVPSIILSNHPNSLFDALVIAAITPAEIRYLVRGDIFKNPIVNFILRDLFMLPVYKKRDDPEYAVKNDFTFDECTRLLEEGKHILIFPEGKSENLWTLRPFMNGGITTLMERAYRSDIPLQIQPYVLNYSSYRYVPRGMKIEALPVIDTTEYIENDRIKTETVILELRSRLQKNMDELPFSPSPINRQYNDWLKVPARIGYFTHYWYYRLCRDFVRRKTSGTIFFDSILFVILLFTYPIVVFFISWILGIFLGVWVGIISFLMLPLFAYCTVQFQPIRVEIEKQEPKANNFEKI